MEDILLDVVNDILLHVYNNISINDLYNCIQVSTQFHRASKNPCVWLNKLETYYSDTYKKLLKKNHYETYKRCHLLTKLKNQLKLSYDIYEISNLQELDLYDNKLTTIPCELGKLINLQELSLSNNQLKTIPGELGQLSNLQKLYLNNNILTTIPGKLGKLINLQELSLYNNKLTTIPCEFGQLSNLQILNLFS